jgi:hypothetical protein
MRKSIVIVALLVFCSLAFGQLESNSITVTASNNTSLQPDQAVFTVIVQSGLTTGLDDVVNALAGSGITAANFTSVGTQINYNGAASSISLQWSFSLTAPLGNTKGTVARLGPLVQHPWDAGFTTIGAIADLLLPGIDHFRNDAGAEPGRRRWSYAGVHSRAVQFNFKLCFESLCDSSDLCDHSKVQCHSQLDRCEDSY